MSGLAESFSSESHFRIIQWPILESKQFILVSFDDILHHVWHILNLFVCALPSAEVRELLFLLSHRNFVGRDG